MFKLRWLMLALLTGALLTIVGEGGGKKLPEEAQAVLAKGETFELLSLHPQRDSQPGEKPDPKAFHGYKILGKIAIKEAAVRKQLLEALDKGMREKVQPARCFIPRHGIHAVQDGKTVDLVICFECHQIHVFVNGKREPVVLVGKSAEPTLDKLLKEAGIPKAK